MFFFCSTADAHMAAIASQTQHQAHQANQSNSTAVNAASSSGNQESQQQSDQDMNLDDQEESLPEPEILPKGIFLFFYFDKMITD